MSFMLLGFWWAIVTFKHDLWMGSPEVRRVATSLTLHFLLPGVMSLISLLGVNNSALWRTGFLLASLAGAKAAVNGHQAQERGMFAGRNWILRHGWKGLFVLYFLIAVVAAGGSDLIQALGMGLVPLEIEGVLVGSELLLGAHFAWSLFVEAGRAQGRSDH